MAATIWVCKIVEKYKIRGQTKETLGQKFNYYMSWQLNAGTNPIYAKSRNYKTGLQHWKDMDGTVTSNGQFQLGTHLM